MRSLRSVAIIAALGVTAVGCSAEVGPATDERAASIERAVESEAAADDVVEDTVSDTPAAAVDSLVSVTIGEDEYLVSTLYNCESSSLFVAGTGEALAPDGTARLVNVLYHDQSVEYGVISLNVVIDDPADPSPDVEWFATVDFPVHEVDYTVDSGVSGTAIFTNGYRAGDGIAELPGSFEVRC